jgi:RNA polymerase sigma-70 factor (ECF subfamily)
MPPGSVRGDAESAGTAGALAALSPSVLERVRARDPEAMGAFCDRYLPYVYGLLHRLTADRATAEDLSQDVFLKVQRALHRLDPQRDPKPWLTTIAYNVCRDHWRATAFRRAHEAHSVDDDSLTTPPSISQGETPLDAVLQSERERWVQAALAALPLQQREVVVLHAYEGLSHDEIARLIGASHAAVRKRYSRAIAALSHSLRRWLT